MELAIYKALKSLNIEESLVDSAINAMEAHFEDRVTRATVPVVAEMRAMKGELSAKLDAFSSKVDVFAQATLKAINRRWIVGTLIGGFALVFTASGVTVGVLKAPRLPVVPKCAAAMWRPPDDSYARKRAITGQGAFNERAHFCDRARHEISGRYRRPASRRSSKPAVWSTRNTSARRALRLRSGVGEHDIRKAHHLHERRGLERRMKSFRTPRTTTQ